ncbi:MAG: HAMP domain-containing protein [Candidatus Marinimicrobia bacterium]|nr:HAMP domain-containing protein [Candidatus Neomarinimicrobiota bacterium]MCF7851376.1 HAMP domain-containing protein [Candidatus Neomarinimicrobiota bacterium]MCF7904210.1 HAMP domain-containing protein [Candidatus Neomarinimicrobiota bacterium]
MAAKKAGLVGKAASGVSFKSFFRPRSLYGQLFMLLLSMSIILFVFLAWLIFSMSNNYLEDVTTRFGKRLAGILNLNVRFSMVTGDHSEMTRAIEEMHEVPGIHTVRIYNNQGDVRHSTPGAEKPLFLDSTFTPATHFQEVDSEILASESACFHKRFDDSQRFMVIHTPIPATPGCRSSGCHDDNNKLLGYTEIELPLQEMDLALNRILYQYFSLVIFFLLILMGTLLFFVQRYINRPLKQVVDASRAVTAGNMSVRIDVHDGDLNDIHHVGMAFNSMLESIHHSSRELQRWSNELENKVRTKSEDIARTQNEIYQIERLASLGRLSSSVAHEINNPLAGILTYAKLVTRILKSPDLTEERKEGILRHMEIIQSETARCGNIVKGLLNFSRDRSQKYERTSVNQVLAESEQLIQHSFQISDTRLVTDFSARRDVILANGNQIIQACLAVLTNALEAIGAVQDGVVTYRSYNPDMDHIVVQIKDNGIGIPQADIDHIFEPFFSSKKEMSGIGLGLAVTYGILEQHKAKVSVESEPGKGTSMRFMFDLADGGNQNE